MIKNAERLVLVLDANYSTHSVFERLFIKPTPARQSSIAYRRFQRRQSRATNSKRLGKYLSRIWHAQEETDTKQECTGVTRILWFERFEAWSRTKFETKLDINEKIKK